MLLVAWAVIAAWREDVRQWTGLVVITTDFACWVDGEARVYVFIIGVGAGAQMLWWVRRSLWRGG